MSAIILMIALATSSPQSPSEEPTVEIPPCEAAGCPEAKNPFEAYIGEEIPEYQKPAGPNDYSYEPSDDNGLATTALLLIVAALGLIACRWKR